jgi:hypothetical protein
MAGVVSASRKEEKVNNLDRIVNLDPDRIANLQKIAKKEGIVKLDKLCSKALSGSLLALWAVAQCIRIVEEGGYDV